MQALVSRPANTGEAAGHPAHENDEVAVGLVANEVAKLWFRKCLPNGVAQSSRAEANKIERGSNRVPMDDVVERVANLPGLIDVRLALYGSEHCSEAWSRAILPPVA